jgi:hypothetical protein
MPPGSLGALAPRSWPVVFREKCRVTEVLGPLQEAGLLRSHRGRIILREREGIEAGTCECDRVVRDEYERLLGVES